MKALALILLYLLPQQALAWGERGHHIITHEAARLIKDIESKYDKKKAVGYFFNDRALALGHLSNLPDTSWKNFKRKQVNAVNFPTHFIDPEVILGVPSNDSERSSFLKKIRRIPADYKTIIKKFRHSKNQLPAKKMAPVELYKNLGTAPWHSQYLYGQLVNALRCGKKKKESAKKIFSSDVQLKLVKSETAVYPTYSCDKKTQPEDDFHTAVAIAGVLSHFIGDLAQPHHSSANYDGWFTGHGGIHVYFESLVVQLLSEDLNAEVAKMIRNKAFQKETWKRIGLPLTRRKSIAQLSLNLAADSNSQIAEIEKLDNTYAIIHRGAAIPWGDSRKSNKSAKEPKRKPASNKTVLKAFRPLIVKQLATGSYILSRIWLQAWKEAGKPNFSKFNAVSFPYLLDVPYIWPEYAKTVLK